jgi:hypothetical protein
VDISDANKNEKTNNKYKTAGRNQISQQASRIRRKFIEPPSHISKYELVNNSAV